MNQRQLKAEVKGTGKNKRTVITRELSEREIQAKNAKRIEALEKKMK